MGGPAELLANRDWHKSMQRGRRVWQVGQVGQGMHLPQTLCQLTGHSFSLMGLKPVRDL